MSKQTQNNIKIENRNESKFDADWSESSIQGSNRSVVICGGNNRGKGRMLKDEVTETLQYMSATWTLGQENFAKLRTAHHKLLLRIIGFQRRQRTDHLTSYAKTLKKVLLIALVYCRYNQQQQRRSYRSGNTIAKCYIQGLSR